MKTIQPEGGGREPIRKLTTPNPGHGPKYRIVRLSGGESKLCTIISSAFWGCQIHWNASNRRSEPCLDDEAKCPGCVGKKPIKRKFYLFVYEGGSKPFFLELTEEAAFEVKEFLAGEKDYRGLRIEFYRTKANNGRINFRMHEQYGRASNLPAEKTPEETLRTLWAWGLPAANQPLTIEP